MEKYFSKFPLMFYSNSVVVDITKRVAMLEKVTQNPYASYPYEISNDERPDQLSYRYYEDPYESWIIYLSNKIVDPYYEWYLTNDEFLGFIENKYGSIYDAQTKINYYRNYWEEGTNISVSAYDALPVGMKKYWTPFYGTSSTIVGYERVKADWIINTNKIVSYTVSNTNFTKDEICKIVFDDNNTGRGQVVMVTNNQVYIQHLSGTYYTGTITGSSYIYGTKSNVNTIFTAVSSVANNISEDEIIYYKPITYFDYETEKNEFNKTIRVLDSKYSQLAADNLKELLKV